MKFIIAIEPGSENTAFGVAVPGLPGCFSAGETLDEAMDNACAAIDFHCATLIEDGEAIPPAGTIAEYQADPDFAGWIWAVVDVPVEKYFGPAERVNITLPRVTLARIDDFARQHNVTRSGFLAEAATAAMRQA